MRDILELRANFDALDLVFFGRQCAVDGVRIRFRKFRSMKHHFLFGLYDQEKRQIHINSRLAERSFPDYVVMATILHEMLHHIIGLEHDVRFLQAEQRYPFYWDAMKWEDAFLQTLE